jgi:hypothetical protein
VAEGADNRLVNLSSYLCIPPITRNFLRVYFVYHRHHHLHTLQVRHGCDINMWHNGPGGCQQTLLHRAIDENKQDVACFLVRR